MAIWAKRIGEGILVGFGAALAFLVFEQLKDATRTLDSATQKIHAQEENNKSLYDEIVTNKKNYQLLKVLNSAELERINTTLDTLAGELEALAKQSASSTRRSNFDWSSVKSNAESQIYVPEVPWVIPKEYADPSVVTAPSEMDWSKYNVDLEKLLNKDGSARSSQPFQLEGSTYDSLKNLGQALEKQMQIPLE